MKLNIDHWAYLSTPPSAKANFKQYAEDFQVDEHLGYSLTGDGEHIYLHIEKTHLNTAFVAEQIAKYCRLPLRQVSYAGRKDKYAVTRQWFGVHLPGKQDVDWSGFDLTGVKVMQATRHNKKLRTGQLAGNTFTIVLRSVTDIDAVINRLHSLEQHGVPNYYGSQRFGVQRIASTGELQQGGNLSLAERMLNGDVIRNRNKRSMALSALRSWLFNEGLSRRLENGTLRTILPGDVVNLSGSNSIFIAQEDLSDLQLRFAKHDLSTTVPLWGKGELGSEGKAHEFEQDLFRGYTEITEFLAHAGLKMERRAAIIWPEQLECQTQGDTLTLRFFLPPGCFATTILRECALTTEFGS